MDSLFHRQAEAEIDPGSPRIWGWSFAVVVFCLTFLSVCVTTSNSRSSTAAIGYLFAPFISGLFAVPGFATGWCTGYFVTWRRSPMQRRRWSAYAAGAVTLLVAGWIVTTLWRGNDLEQEVARVERMNSAQLEAVMRDPKLARNKFILGAIATHPKASASVLHKIVATDLPELSESMSSAFEVLGKNGRGMAVMRLVARHPNAAPEDLEFLANSKTLSVREYAASSGKLSEATIRRLANEDPFAMAYNLSGNAATPRDVLSTLALSADEGVRARVGRNPHTPDDVPRGLSVDSARSVREAVALNKAAGPDILEKLAQDPDPQVSRHVVRRQPPASQPSFKCPDIASRRGPTVICP
ncbi:MAG: Leucine rich repeat protein [Bryobacterales bacterium]|nr:Leucine rich repeat protein [Bryobacterales bacterium]